ncbi:MAG: SDR family oxidoreductase [Actinocatenispora sp.]
MARTVLVTGGNRGIGLAIAKAFAKQGDRVAITHRGNWEPEEGIFGVTCDVTDSAAVDAAFTAVEEELGPVEVLVANAGMTVPVQLNDMTEDQFVSVLDTNLTGAWRCAKRAAKSMGNARWGRMIFVSSAAGMCGSPGETNYAASKSGLVGMARSITRELATRGVTANVVSPGFVETDMVSDIPKNLRTFYERCIPAGRFGHVDEVTPAVLWLAGETSGYVNGSIITIDGGLSMGH